jgi:cell volume regulation protein A
MATTEPLATAFLLVVLGVLVGASALFSRASRRLGLPVALLFLAIGMAAGAEGIGGIAFQDYGFAFRVGTIALVLILFDGGLSTPIESFRGGLGPASVLATAGVLGTAALAGASAWAFGMALPEALLLGAVVSSTDAAAVFSVLRGAGVQLKRRVGVTLELESGLNDPVAVILTVALVSALGEGAPPGVGLLGEALLQIAVGGACGAAIGFAGRALLVRTRVAAAGLYPVLTLSLALVAFGAPTLLRGSGFLSVYVAGILIGNGPLPFRSGILRVHNSIAWLGQVTMFLLLGLLVSPFGMMEVRWTGLGIALVLAFVARPAVVWLCLAPFRFEPKEIAYVGWVGLRGAVPIILAMFPVLAGAPGAQRLFEVVFFVVVLNAIVPGATVRLATRWLGVEETAAPPPAPASIDFNSSRVLGGEVLSLYVREGSSAAEARVGDLPIPQGAAVMLLVRGVEPLPASAAAVLRPGDHVFVYCPPDQTRAVRELFGELEAA